MNPLFWVVPAIGDVEKCGLDFLLDLLNLKDLYVDICLYALKVLLSAFDLHERGNWLFLCIVEGLFEL